MLPLLSTSERSRYDSVGSSTSNSGDEPNTSGLSTLGRVSLKRKKLFYLFDGYRQSENLMKQSNVLASNDAKTWDWEIITTILIKVSNRNNDINCIDLLTVNNSNYSRQILAAKWIYHFYVRW